MISIVKNNNKKKLNDILEQCQLKITKPLLTSLDNI